MLFVLIVTALSQTAALRAETLPVPPALNQETQAFIQTQARQSQAVISIEDRANAEAIAAQSAAVVNTSIDQAARAANLPAIRDRGLRIRVFVSRALPREDQAAAIALAQDDPRITLVFRGLLPNTRLADLKHWLAEHLGPIAALRRTPRIELDPPAFRDAQIETVPVVALYRDGARLSQVAGLLDPAWLEDELAAGRTGPYAARGPTHEIAEPDLISVMQAKARSIDWPDWQRQQREALHRSLKAQALPRAQRDRVRFHDPSFVVQETIRAEQTVIAEAGTRINPLQILPFTQELWVLDATDPAHWTLLKQWLHTHAHTASSTRITLLTTALPEQDSLRWLDARAREIGQPMQLWRADFSSAFGIVAVPSRLRAEHGQFRIDEFRVTAATGATHADRQTTP